MSNSALPHCTSFATICYVFLQKRSKPSSPPALITPTPPMPNFFFLLFLTTPPEMTLPALRPSSARTLRQRQSSENASPLKRKQKKQKRLHNTQSRPQKGIESASIKSPSSCSSIGISSDVPNLVGVDAICA
jgi:hypothetical protein